MLVVFRDKAELKQNAFKTFLKPKENDNRKYRTIHGRNDSKFLRVVVPSLHLCHQIILGRKY